jgi:hypothetical protein
VGGLKLLFGNLSLPWLRIRQADEAIYRICAIEGDYILREMWFKPAKNCRNTAESQLTFDRGCVSGAGYFKSSAPVDQQGKQVKYVYAMARR